MKDILIHLSIMIVAVMLPFLISWITIVFISISKEKTTKKLNAKNDVLLVRAFNRLSIWFMSTTFWMIAEYIFVILPFVANVIVIYITNTNDPNIELVLLYSIVSLSFIVFGYAVNPQRHKKCYREAYNLLDNQINIYLLTLEPGKANDEILIKALKDGENFIDRSYDIE